MNTQALLKILKEYGLAVGSAVLVALLVRGFVLESYRISGHAMEPTLLPGDTVYAVKWGLTPKRGDVIVYATESPYRAEWVRRVVGLPKDKISIKDGRVTINGQRIEYESEHATEFCWFEKLESKIWQACKRTPLIEDLEIEGVPEGSVFVLGDHRTQMQVNVSNSRAQQTDRVWAIVPMKGLEGRVKSVLFSIEPKSSRDADWFSRIRINRVLMGL